MIKAIGGKTAGIRARTVFGAAAAALVFSALVLVGCGKDDEEGGGGNLVCADGEAWVFCSGRRCIGMVFRPDGKLQLLSSGDGGTTWSIDEVATYSISGNTFSGTSSDGETLRNGKGGSNITYNVSGDKLTTDIDDLEEITFTKRSGVNPS